MFCDLRGEIDYLLEPSWDISGTLQMFCESGPGGVLRLNQPDQTPPPTFESQERKDSHLDLQSYRSSRTLCVYGLEVESGVSVL